MQDWFRVSAIYVKELISVSFLVDNPVYRLFCIVHLKKFKLQMKFYIGELARNVGDNIESGSPIRFLIRLTKRQP